MALHRAQPQVRSGSRFDDEAHAAAVGLLLLWLLPVAGFVAALIGIS